MKKTVKLLFIFLSILMIIPTTTKAISKDYEDITYKIVEEKVEENKVNLYLFHRYGCPHCEKELEFLKEIKDKYKNLNIYTYEVTTSKINADYYKKVKDVLKDTSNGVPYTVIGNKSFLGYNELIGSRIESAIQDYLEINEKTENEKNTYKLPLIGEVNAKDISIPFVAMVLGLVDGFNPCAMWILLFLINMFFGMKNKKKMFIL